MQYPTLLNRQTSREIVDAFRGYNHNLRIGAGEFFDMENLTSDYYPVLSPRRKRGFFTDPENPQGMISKDALCYIDGTHFVMNEYRVDMGLSTEPEDCPKQLTSMGAYVIIMPDKKWINTMDLSEYGDIEAVFQSTQDVSISLCTADGVEYGSYIVGDAQPTDPENMDLWMDTSNTPHVLKKYSSSTDMWVAVPTTYVKLYSPNMGKGFKQFDGVTISGIKDEALQDLNGSHVIWQCGDDYIVVIGILDMAVVQTPEDGAITVERRMPNMDFITESENRLWGCRYGLAANGEVVNEIYACKLGDFKNWNCFMSLSTDSYAASCGTDGRFTGAITHLGYPLFFKENFVHKVFGNYPANFQIQTTPLRGVQRGSERSLVIVNEVLYYKSAAGICAYDGSLPVDISGALGDVRYDNAVAGYIGNKYYVSMRDVSTGEYCLFVYDTYKGMWHKEDSLKVDFFCSARDDLYAVSGGKVITILGSGVPDESPIHWSATTGEIGIASPDTKYISRITLRMSLAVGSELRIFARYDFSNEWESLGCIRGTDLRSFSLPIRPQRCDYMVLRLEGTGDGKIYSITKTIEQGSEIT